MLIRKMLQVIAVVLIPLLLLPGFTFAQVTSSSMSGVIKTATGEPLVGATVTATHEPTGVVYKTQTRTGGRFEISNMNPGGPYTVEVTFVNFVTEKRSDIYLNLGEVYKLDASLNDKANELTAVTVVSTRQSDVSGKGGAEVNIGRDKMANLPSVGRNISDYLRFVPQVKVTGDGGIAVAGQNNRYNSFYIDGAVNNDVFGLAASGTNGGQAGVAPISIDAIDQFQVVISPYDASIGNFTGGAINAVTRSGTNTIQGSAYMFYRNQDLTGKTPTGLKDNATKLGKFSAKTYGFRVGGPIIRSKLFYFVNLELQRDERPQPFAMSQYGGTYTADSINKLANFVRTTYGYDPGSYLDIPEIVNADRFAAKIDWNLNTTNRLSVSHRYNKGERYNTSSGSSTRINFFNNGYLFPTTTNSSSVELKSSFRNGKNNRLLLTFTNVKDDRGAIGSPFPRVEIQDQSSARLVVLGTENFSTSNLLKQQNFNLLDWFKMNVGKNYLTFGTDNELSYSYNAFIRNNYGTYRYGSINDFIKGYKPLRYDRSYSLVDNKSGDNTDAAAEFTTLRLGFFVNDEIRVNENLTVNAGIRADWTKFLTDPKEDRYFNDTGRALVAAQYDLEGARSGQMSKVPVSLSPRIGFTYKIPAENVTVRGGFGWFTGRIPLVWPGGVYNLNGVSIGDIAVNNPNITFRPDPFGQYTATDLGLSITNKGELNLITEEFKLPKLFRTSLAVDKRFSKGWTFTVEGIFSKNINEIDYTQVNIMPPTQMSAGPDRRNVYAFGGTPTRILSRYSGDIYLLSNNKDRKGFAYNFTFTVDKAFRNGFAFNANYSYGTSIVLNEGTSSQNSSQWRFMETVNGRNYITLSQSDFDLGHRINAYVSKKFNYGKGRFATTVSLVYNGQSGSPFSYVYSASPVGDRSRFETNDLIY
ncbi:MAG TPA: carboxypeptidase regulatory-like domain-containing protein, partial [Chitinophagaceae bacterium]